MNGDKFKQSERFLDTCCDLFAVMVCKDTTIPLAREDCGGAYDATHRILYVPNLFFKREKNRKANIASYLHEVVHMLRCTFGSSTEKATAKLTAVEWLKSFEEQVTEYCTCQLMTEWFGETLKVTAKRVLYYIMCDPKVEEEGKDFLVLLKKRMVKEIVTEVVKEKIKTEEAIGVLFNEGVREKAFEPLQKFHELYWGLLLTGRHNRPIEEYPESLR